MHLLAWCHASDCGTRQDDCKAFESYRNAAERGLAVSQLGLSQCFENGKGVAIDAKLAEDWLRRALGGTDDDASRLALAMQLLDFDQYGGSIEAKEGVKRLSELGERGYGMAEFKLSLHHMKLSDDPKRLEHLRKAAELGVAEAQLEFARHLLQTTIDDANGNTLPLCFDSSPLLMYLAQTHQPTTSAIDVTHSRSPILPEFVALSFLRRCSGSSFHSRRLRRASTVHLLCRVRDTVRTETPIWCSRQRCSA